MRDRPNNPLPGDVFDAKFEELICPCIPDSATTMTWTVRVITVEEPGFVGVKLYGSGRYFWPMETFCKRAANAVYLSTSRPD